MISELKCTGKTWLIGLLVMLMFKFVLLQNIAN